MTAFGPGFVVDHRYEIIELIGEGGMGTVFKAVDRQSSGEVAIKICRSRDLDVQRRFAREIRLMANVDHPNVVQVLWDGLDHDPPYFVMPIAIGSLDDELAELAKDEHAALEVFKQLCFGVEALHNAGTIHRDLKPANALRLSGNSVVVSDLGLARLDSRDTTTLTQTNQFLGTRMYSAPEQLMPPGSREADRRTDVYQLGKTLYHLLTGRSPALIESPLVSPGLLHIIRQATREDPDERYQSVAEVLDAVELYERSKDPSADPINLIEQLVEQIRGHVGTGEFSREEVRHLLHLVEEKGRAAGDEFVTVWDMIPEEVLPAIAEHFAEELKSVLRVYLAKLEGGLRGRNWSYAEVVARQMWAIVRYSRDSETKAMCIEATLVAAVAMNRFAAMDVFNQMIRNVKDDGDAAAVAAMLVRHKLAYARLADSVPAVELHPLIRQVRERVLAEEK